MFVAPPSGKFLKASWELTELSVKTHLRRLGSLWRHLKIILTSELKDRRVNIQLFYCFISLDQIKPLILKGQHISRFVTKCLNCRLTVITQGSSEGGHAAVAAEALPLLQTHALVGARVLLAGGAGTWTRRRKKAKAPWGGFYLNGTACLCLCLLGSVTRWQQASANGGIRSIHLQKHTAAVFSVKHQHKYAGCKKWLGLKGITFDSKTEARKKKQQKLMYFSYLKYFKFK